MKRRKPYAHARDPVTGKRVLAHRLLIEQQLGRPLQPHEVVHHRDGNSLNNDLDNLIVLPSQRFHAHAEFHSRRARTGMVPLFPEYFQGVPESRGTLFDHVLVEVLNAPPLARRQPPIQARLSGVTKPPELLKLTTAPVPDIGRGQKMFLIPEHLTSGSKLLSEILACFTVSLEDGAGPSFTRLQDLYPAKIS